MARSQGNIPREPNPAMRAELDGLANNDKQLSARVQALEKAEESILPSIRAELESLVSNIEQLTTRVQALEEKPKQRRWWHS